MKKELKILLALMILPTFLVGCSTSNTDNGTDSGDDTPTHIHMSKEWHGDETYHWLICDECNEEFDKAKHNFFEEERDFIAPSCTEDGGYDVYNICHECGYECLKEHIVEPAHGHTYASYANYEWSEDNSECTATRTCDYDSSHIERETAKAISEVVKTATCTSQGEIKYTATFVNPSFKQQIKYVYEDELGHDWGEPTYSWNVDYSICTAERVCKTNEDHVSTIAVNSSVEAIITATETEEGLNRYTAIFDSDEYETQVIEVATSATYMQDLFDISGYYYSDTLNAWCCSLRAKSDVISGDIIVSDKYEAVPVGSVSFENCTKITSVTLPNTIDEIGYRCFYNCSSLTSVVIPNSVTSISRSGIVGGAFEGCSSLKSITIPESVKYIGERAFAGCPLESITVYDTLKTIDDYAFMYTDDLYVKITSFSNCLNVFDKTSSGLSVDNAIHLLDEDNQEITDVVIPDDVTSIGKYAFAGCKNIKSVDIGDGVKEIGEKAFNNCTALNTLDIGKSLENIDETFLGECKQFTNFIVDEENPYFTKYQGILYNKDKTTIVRAPRYGLFGYVFIPETVDTIANYAFYTCTGLTQILSNYYNNIAIGDYAFYGCNNLSSINIPKYGDNGITAIGDYAFENCVSLDYLGNISAETESIGDSAFENCSSLTSLTIGSGVKVIGERAFWECEALSAINFNGTMEEWNAITFETDWNYDVPATVVHCTDGDIRL